MIQLLTLSFLDKPFLGARISDFLWCGGIMLGALLLKRPFSIIIATLAARVAVRFSDGKYRGLFKNLVRKPIEWLFAITLFFIALNYIAVPLNKLTIMHYQRKEKAVSITLADVIDHVFLFFAIYLTALTVSRLVDFLYRTQMGKAHRDLQKERTQLLPLLRELIKFLIWTIAFFWILGVVFQVNIPALIAGLGIGGIALALAAKESVENLFASLTILSDKPFQVGDTIKVSGLEGKVERIGFRSAKLRGSNGTLYVIPNKKLVDESLENLTQRHTRGITVVLNIKYGISRASLELMIEELKTMVKNSLHVKDPIRVALETFNEKAFQLVVSYHVPEPLMDSTWTEVKQLINIKTYEIVMKYSAVTDATTELDADDDDDEV
jgi:MscS family membrane protein